MKKLKRLLGILITITMSAAFMTACENKENSSSELTSETYEPSENTENTNPDTKASSEYFSDFDLDTDFSDPDAQITLNGSSAEISGNGAVYEDNKITITSEGTYVFSGTLDDGQIYVNSDENVHLVFNGVNITNKSSSPVFVENAKNVSITAADNTENVLTDGTDYLFESAEENEPDAVIFSKDDLSLNGNGTLTINANYNEGITCKNDIRFAGGNISITSVGNAVKGKDSVVVHDTVININSGEDGIKSSNTEETDKGYIVFESGEFNITAENDAVQSENFLTVNGGTFNITTGGGSETVPEAMQEMFMGDKGNFAKPDMQMPTDENGEFAMPDRQMPTDENGNFVKPDMQMPTDENGEFVMPDNAGGFGFGGGRMDRDSFEAAQTETGAEDTVESQKGLKSAKGITINGGFVNADCSDDSIHAAENIEINGGEFGLNSGDDGIHSDTNIKISNGSITIHKSYEGIEAAVIDVDGGTVDVTASDDGFNASDGTGSTMNPMAVSENCSLNINDGAVYVNSGGDGLDSNGSLNVNGGCVLVDGPENDGNCAIDSGSINLNGGVLIAAGSSGMLETPSADSEQNSVVASFDTQKEALTPVYITDEKGEILFSYTPSKSYSAVIVSAPSLETGKEYSLYTGGKVTVTETEYNWKNYCEKPEISGGELTEKITLSETVTRIGNAGFGQMGGNRGGRGDFGGRNMQ